MKEIRYSTSKPSPLLSLLGLDSWPLSASNLCCVSETCSTKVFSKSFGKILYHWVTLGSTVKKGLITAKGPWFILSVGPATSETRYRPVLAVSTLHQHIFAKISHAALISTFTSSYSAKRKLWSTEVSSLS